MRALLLGFLAACGGAVATDPCAVPLATQWGSAEDDEALALVPARAGGVYVAGYRGGKLRVSNLGPVGDARAFVRRLDPSGAVRWETALDTAQADLVEALAEAPDGRLYAAGRTTGAFAGATQGGQFDGFVALLLDTGEVRAVRQFGDERPQHPRRLALWGARVLLAGLDDVYVPSNYVEAWENWFAADLSADDLSEAWWSASRTDWGDGASAVAVDAEGFAYVGGSNSGGSQAGIWLRKLDRNGAEVWGSRLSSTGVDTTAALAFARNGDVLLAGTRFGGSQPVVIAVDRATGAPRFTFSGPRDLNGTAVTDMTVDGEGNLYLTGSTLTPIAPQYRSRGSYDPYVMRFDPQGVLTGTWQGGSGADEEPTAIALDACGRVLIAGWTDGVLAGAASSGRRDAFLLSVPLQSE